MAHTSISDTWKGSFFYHPPLHKTSVFPVLIVKLNKWAGWSPKEGKQWTVPFWHGGHTFVTMKIRTECSDKVKRGVSMS